MTTTERKGKVIRPAQYHDSLTFAHVEEIALALAVDRSKTTWFCHFALTAYTVGIKPTSVIVETAKIVRFIDQDYANNAANPVALGSVAHSRENGTFVQIVEGLDVSVMEWFVTLCKTSGVNVALPSSAQRVLDLMK